MFLAFCLALAAQVSGGSEDLSPNARPLYEINREISVLFQRDSLAKSESDRAAAAYEMTLLYREILADPRLTASPTLKEYRGRLWSRLTRIKKDVLAKLRREAKDQVKDAQDEEAAINQSSLATLSMADHFALVGATLGGPAGVYALGAAGGRAGPPDFGPDLVDLIQRTIQPDFWDVNGGPGSIVYYRQLHVLVVRANSEVHQQLGGVINGLR